jgi:hypothetical protein
MADRKDVFAITKNGEKSFWIKIGSAFVNKDNSLNVRLNAFPVNGELHIRDPKPKENPA